MADMRLATDGQMARLLQIKAKKRLPFDDVQALIRKSVFDPKSSDRHLPYWEYKFPNKGELLFRILQPYYDWDKKIKPTLPDLETRLYPELIEKLSLNGVRVVQYAANERQEIIWEIHLGTEIRVAYWPLLISDDVRLYFNVLRRSIAEQFQPIFRESCLPSYEGALIELLFITCIAGLTDKMALVGEVAPLLDFWLAGNVPIGIDRRRNLVVLAAD